MPGLWRTGGVRDTVDNEEPDGHDYETVGGFVMARLGRIPVVGDVVTVPGWNIHVVGMAGRRVDRLRFVPATDEPDRVGSSS